MRQRAEQALLALLICVAVVLAVALWRLRRRAAEQPAVPAAPQALNALSSTPPAPVTLMLANDNDGALVAEQRTVALPEERTARARLLLNQLLSAYTLPGSAHPIAPNTGVDDVFFLPLPGPARGTAAKEAPQGTLAVVNLSGSLVHAHPSGIEPETMTLLSIIGTLHANLPEVTEVRFLVEGAARETLAGHADLTSTYLAASTAAPVPEQPSAAGAGSGEPLP